MNTQSSDIDFSYRLTESLLSLNLTTPNSTLSQTTPRIVTPLPMIIQQTDSNSSFNQYIENKFKQDAPVFLDRLQVPSQQQGPTEKESLTFWSYLSQQDVTNNNEEENFGANNKSTWYEYDSIFKTTASAAEQEPFVTETFFSMGAFFFLIGFIFPPFWWIGSFYPKIQYSKMDSRWRLMNRFFSLGFSTLLIIAIIVLAIVYSKTS